MMILKESEFPEGAKFFPKPYSERNIVEAITALLGEPAI
jgi:hypothetical protein